MSGNKEEKKAVTYVIARNFAFADENGDVMQYKKGVKAELTGKTEAFAKKKRLIEDED